MVVGNDTQIARIAIALLTIKVLVGFGTEVDPLSVKS